MLKRREEYPTLEACKKGQLRQYWERERDKYLAHNPVEQAEELAAQGMARHAFQEWCTLETHTEDEPSESEIVLFEWLAKRDWKQLFAPFGVIPGPEERRQVHAQDLPKPRVLDLISVQDAYRTGWEIRYNAQVRQTLKHRVGAALAFCATKEDAEEVRHRLYAAYREETMSHLLAPYTRIFPLGRSCEPLRLINEALLIKRKRPIYVQRCVGALASYQILRYPYQRDERFVVSSIDIDERDFHPGHFIERYDEVVAEIYVLGDTQELLDLAAFYDPIATVEWDGNEQHYRGRAALIGHESLDEIASTEMQEVVERCLGRLEQLLIEGIAKRQQERSRRARTTRRIKKTQWTVRTHISGPYITEV